MISSSLTMEQLEELISFKGAESMEEDIKPEVSIGVDNVEEQAPSADDIAEKKPAQKRRRKEDPVTKCEDDKKAREASNKAERDFYRSLLNDEEAFNKAWGPIMEAESKLRTCAPACCGIEFESMASFRRHKQRVHQEKPPPKVKKPLPMAEKAPKKAGEAPGKVDKAPAKTEKTPAGESSTVHKCKECSKEFKVEGSLRNHMELDHRLAFECTTCLKRYQTLINLKRHIHIVHSNAEQFLCNTCGKVLKSKGSLEDHTRTHTGEKPYSCPRCPYRGSSSSLLAHHKVRVHNLKTTWTWTIG